MCSHNGIKIQTNSDEEEEDSLEEEEEMDTVDEEYPLITLYPMLTEADIPADLPETVGKEVFLDRVYSWCRIPQGFSESPSIFNQILKKNLESLELSFESTLVQYIGDLLIASKTENDCTVDTIALLNHLGRNRHKGGDSDPGGQGRREHRRQAGGAPQGILTAALWPRSVQENRRSPAGFPLPVRILQGGAACCAALGILTPPTAILFLAVRPPGTGWR
ncbi:hypothetical protein NDU88_002723 [Pleurodeles waltl]|uniref:ribonuclease H n=1 Tax=Pleurodeles waltl TaxID=8319 RepID=A0AAV7NHB8_PLEWA|nr:hypothetical protein NDU88_002723 [Pleurodeles waltl]